MPDTGPLQVVQLDEVVETVLFFLSPEAPSRLALDVAGPERLTFNEVVSHYRLWLGWKPARTVGLPAFLARLLYWLGDLAGLLGWRPALRSTARREMARGAVGDPGPWLAITGVRSRTLAMALLARPPIVQERWFAGLYLLKLVIFITFSLFWIGTGLISLGPGYEHGLAYMERAGAGSVAAPGVIAGGIADIMVGLAIAYRPTARLGLWGALLLTAFYIITGTILLPELWSDPLGPMLKIWPILALNLAAFAMLEER